MMYYSKTAKGFYNDAIFETLPSDAVEVSTENYQSLLNGESLGRIIICDKDGYPVLAEAPELTKEEMAAIGRGNRDALLMETDYLVMPDYPQDATALATIKKYRQALRDVPAQPDFPDAIDWPVRP